MRLLITLLTAASLTFAATITVPGDHSQIQSAIDASSPGDTVLVSPGTYFENIDFSGKAITVVSTDGAESTVIDAGGFGSVVKFTSAETRSSILDGFTIQNGTGTLISPFYYGGGINCTASSPTIRNNIIRQNTGYHAGGILCYIGGSPLIEYNIFENNTADHYGAGIYITSSSAEVTGNVIRNNTAGSGAGITVAYNSSCTATNNLIYGNSASKGAGIMGLINGTVTLNNCTVASNAGTNSSGGIYGYNSSLTVTNSIFWGNTAPTGAQCNLYNGQGTFSYTNVQGGETDVVLEGSATLNWGEGMIETDPLFETGDLSDYHLGTGSDCIDGGNPASQYNDTEDPNNPGFPLWPALGTLNCDMGVYGGSFAGGWVSVEDFIEAVPGAEVTLRVLQNPSSGYAAFQLAVPYGQPSQISVYDTAGRQVRSGTVQDSGACLMDLSDLGTGIYIVRLVSPAGNAYQSFTLLNKGN
jgi:parallel beta-helix repeat protein